MCHKTHYHEEERDIEEECCHHMHHKPIPIRGFAHLAVLKIIKEKSTSGSEIQKTLSENYGFEVPKPIIYGLLRKLEGMGLLISKWDTSEPGPAKRIYTITEEGLEYLQRGLEKVGKFKELIEKLLS
ncbi:MAG: PadR family transcriptional regulator [Candidatus Methanomethylicia archaeon]